MVNTFLPSFPVEEGIACLDNARLGKQRVEAQQILNILLAAQAMTQLLGYPACPSLPENASVDQQIQVEMAREQWLKQVYTRYKQSRVKLYSRVGQDRHREYLSVFEPGCAVVGAGFYAHPMTLMWVGYESGLKAYINLCICAWIARGFDNQMPLHLLFKEPEWPWWVRSPTLHKSHQAALLRKEAVRQEPDWYWKMSWAKEIASSDWYTAGYFWLPHLSLVDRQRVRKADSPSFCDPIKNDFV